MDLLVGHAQITSPRRHPNQRSRTLSHTKLFIVPLRESPDTLLKSLISPASVNGTASKLWRTRLIPTPKREFHLFPAETCSLCARSANFFVPYHLQKAEVKSRDHKTLNVFALPGNTVNQN